jgi:hypothetical protein
MTSSSWLHSSWMSSRSKGVMKVWNARVMREHLEEGFGSGVDVVGLLVEKVEKTLFARQKPLQKSWHVR